MGGVISSGDENWFTRNYEFRELLAYAQEHVDQDDDRYVLEQAKWLHGLHFDLIGAEQGLRLADALEIAAEELQWRVARDRREAGFHRQLGELPELLSRFRRSAADPS